MKFDIPKDYFLDEVRDGFLVPSMIKKSWAVSIVDYKILEEICDKLGVNLFFMYGSLIAVIRHAGSIPWDDDIDSMIFHDEYQKLKVYLDNGGMPENFRMNDYSQMGTGNLVRKWLDNYGAVKDRSRWEESFGFPFVNNIDVMLIDYLPDGEKNMQYYRDVVELLQYVKDFADVIEAGAQNYDKEEFEYSLDLLERVLKVKYDEHTDGKLSVWVWKMLDEFTARYTARDGSEVASVAHYMTHGNGKFNKRLYQDYLDMPYEFTTVKVPVGYEGILRNFFGDYMTPVLEWDGHVYPFYKNLERALQEKYDVELLRYHFREEEVSEVLSQKETKISVRETFRSAVGVFAEAHEYILKELQTISDADTEKRDEICGVLGSCQQLAVDIGGIVEDRLARKEDIDRIVGFLEEYCEKIYGLYQMTSGETEGINNIDIDDIQNVFSGLEKKLCDDTMESDEKIKVVFLCTRDGDWKSLQTVWDAAIADDRVDVKVIAVPYYIKDAMGEVSRDDMIIDTAGYPEAVELTPYDEYDIQAEHPDIVIYQAPYDGYSDAMTIHPYYYVSNIRKYADYLVFIPPFVLREVSSGDERSKYVIGCFIDNPGTVYADMVVVQSDGMRDVYISVLDNMIKRDFRYTKEDWTPDKREYEKTDYVAEEQALIDQYEGYVPSDQEVGRYIDWGSKIYSYGSGLYDWEDKKRILLRTIESNKLYDKSGDEVSRSLYDEVVDVPDEWIEKMRKSEGTFKKVLLYAISAGVAFEYGESVFNKAINAIKMIDRYHSDDIVVLVYEDKNYRQALRKNNPKAWSACQKFISYVRESAHIYDDTRDEDRAALICDACYGDGSSVLNKCRELKRPVMIESPDIEVDVPDQDDVEKDTDIKTTDNNQTTEDRSEEPEKPTYGEIIWKGIIEHAGYR